MKNLASESTIHSLNYIFGENRHKIVRAIWFLLFLTSFSGFSFYLYISYIKLQIIPDISMRRDEKPTTNYPMAAITICQKVFFSREYLEMISSSNVSQKRSGCELFAANVHWCESFKQLYLEEAHGYCVRNLKEEMNKINVLNLISKSEEPVRKTSDLLPDQRIFTHHGICRTSNMLDGKAIFNEDVIHEDFKEYWSNEKKSKIEWTVEKGYFSEKAFYPESIYLNFIQPYYFEIKSEFIFCCTMYAIIHLPSEMPTEFHKFIPITYGSRSAVLITAKSYRTDEALRNFSPESRNCYFEGERKLKFFKTYSKPHCQLECLTNFTLKACGCVLFWMPRNQTTSVCKFSDLQCIEFSRNHKNKKDKPTCSCYSACNDIKYEVEYLPTNIMFQLTSRYA